jgi:hypothetical protein
MTDPSTIPETSFSMEGGEEAMVPAISKAIESTWKGRHLTVPSPPLPTEDSWAVEMARLYNWT